MAHILVVDADELAAEHAAQVMMDAGHACGWVSSSDEAWKVINRRRPDVLLLEDKLAGESGTTLLRKLRQSPKFYDLPVIMLTATLGFKEEQIAYYNGAQHYVRKPYSPAMLQFRVRQLLETRRNYGRHSPIAEQLGVVEQQSAPQPRRIV